ncbi:MAG: MurR/RpiR family transcriptional regulator [Anaerococcus sp.]
MKGDDIEEIINKSKRYVVSSIEKTYALFDKEKIKEAVYLINKANTIYLSGVGSSGIICEDFFYKLQRSGKKVIYEKDAHFNLSAITNIRKDDILICISYAGKTKEIITAAEYANYNKTKVISISKTQKSELATYSDILLLVPDIESEMRFGAVSSRFSTLMITDILYYGYISKNMDQIVSNLKVSKNLTNYLK